MQITNKNHKILLFDCELIKQNEVIFLRANTVLCGSNQRVQQELFHNDESIGLFKFPEGIKSRTRRIINNLTLKKI